MTLLLTAISDLCLVFWGVILARVVYSWIRPPDFRDRIFRLLYELTEPFLGPIRRVLPPVGGMDLSPLVASVILLFLAQLL